MINKKLCAFLLVLGFGGIVNKVEARKPSIRSSIYEKVCKSAGITIERAGPRHQVDGDRGNQILIVDRLINGQGPVVTRAELAVTTQNMWAMLNE